MYRILAAIFFANSACALSPDIVLEPGLPLPTKVEDEKVNDFFEIRENLKFTIRAVYNGEDKVWREIQWSFLPTRVLYIF